MRWQEQSACTVADAQLFHPDDDQYAWVATAAAKKICGGCPVAAECLQAALDADDPHGIWGGLTPAERSKVRGDSQTRTTCDGCNDSFPIAAGSRRRMCDVCSVARRAASKRAYDLTKRTYVKPENRPAKQPKPCVVCSDMFVPPVRHAHQTTCTKTCRAELGRRSKAAWDRRNANTEKSAA